MFGIRNRKKTASDVSGDGAKNGHFSAVLFSRSSENEHESVIALPVPLSKFSMWYYKYSHLSTYLRFSLLKIIIRYFNPGWVAVSGLRLLEYKSYDTCSWIAVRDFRKLPIPKGSKLKRQISFIRRENSSAYGGLPFSYLLA